MKTTKTICAVIALSLLLSAFCGLQAVYAAEAEDLAAVQCLKDLGGADFTEETDFAASLTRAQFCGVLRKYLRMENQGTGNMETTPFIDVDPTRKDFRDIRTIYDMGYISGVGTRYFYPDQG